LAPKEADLVPPEAVTGSRQIGTAAAVVGLLAVGFAGGLLFLWLTRMLPD
jgi:hypothetical protein